MGVAALDEFKVDGLTAKQRRARAKKRQKAFALSACAVFVALGFVLPMLEGLGVVSLPAAGRHDTDGGEEWAAAASSVDLRSAVSPDLCVSLAERVRASNLRESVKYLCDEVPSRHIDSLGNFMAREYIYGLLQRFGYSTYDNTLEIQDFSWQEAIVTEEWQQVRVEVDEDGNEITDGGDEDGDGEGEEDSSDTSESSGSSDSSDSSGSSSNNKKKKYKWVWKKVTKTTYVTYESKNVLAVIPAEDAGEEGAEPAPIIVICAHYDDVRATPGAVDNASGVASALEAARILRAARGRHRAEIRICFFSAEEQGVYGSKAWLASLTDEERSRIAGAINLDMTAGSTDSNVKALTISTYGALTADGYISGTTEAPLDNIASLAAKRAYELDPSIADRLYLIHWDKHDGRSFDRAGLDCVTISWREIDPERAVNRFNIAAPEVMHEETDTSASLDYDALSATTRLALRSFEELYDAVFYAV